MEWNLVYRFASSVVVVVAEAVAARGTRTGRIATCIYNRCLKAVDTEAIVCVGDTTEGCEDPKLP